MEISSRKELEAHIKNVNEPESITEAWVSPDCNARIINHDKAGVDGAIIEGILICVKDGQFQDIMYIRN